MGPRTQSPSRAVTKKKPAKPAMRKHTDAHPGIEMDGKGHPVPVGDRLAEDRRKVRRASATRARRKSK